MKERTFVVISTKGITILAKSRPFQGDGAPPHCSGLDTVSFTWYSSIRCPPIAVLTRPSGTASPVAVSSPAARPRSVMVWLFQRKKRGEGVSSRAVRKKGTVCVWEDVEVWRCGDVEM